MNLQAVIEDAIAAEVFPGAAWAVGCGGKSLAGFAGRHSYHEGCCPVDETTLWDLASLTKVVGTTALAMRLWEQGLVDLDRRVSSLLPAFEAAGKGDIQIKHLLAHNSGLAATGVFGGRELSASEIFAEIDAGSLAYPTGTRAVYSDLGFIVLGRFLQSLCGESLESLTERNVFESLGMTETVFNPNLPLRLRAAPTELVQSWRTALRAQDIEELRNAEVFLDGTRYVRGEVHDPTAMMLGGVAGHAGLFSTLGDLVRFARSLLGIERPLFSPKTVSKFSARDEMGTAESSRALGWDTNWRQESSAGPTWPEDSFGHTGYTGTSIWLDLPSQTYAILLTNRVHPSDGDTRIREVRRQFHSAVNAIF